RGRPRHSNQIKKAKAAKAAKAAKVFPISPPLSGQIRMNSGPSGTRVCLRRASQTTSQPIHGRTACTPPRAYLPGSRARRPGARAGGVRERQPILVAVELEHRPGGLLDPVHAVGPEVRVFLRSDDEHVSRSQRPDQLVEVKRDLREPALVVGQIPHVPRLAPP